MPVGAVGGGGAGDGLMGEGEVVGAGGVPEGDCVGREILISIRIVMGLAKVGVKGNIQSHRQRCARRQPPR